jgi:hypothetical protein
LPNPIVFHFVGSIDSSQESTIPFDGYFLDRKALEAEEAPLKIIWTKRARSRDC